MRQYLHEETNILNTTNPARMAHTWLPCFLRSYTSRCYNYRTSVCHRRQSRCFAHFDS